MGEGVTSVNKTYSRRSLLKLQPRKLKPQFPTLYFIHFSDAVWNVSLLVFYINSECSLISTYRAVVEAISTPSKISVLILLPFSKVEWYNFLMSASGNYEPQDTGDGVGTGVSRLFVTLTRADLLAEYTCLVESDALVHPIESRIYPNVRGELLRSANVAP